MGDMRLSLDYLRTEGDDRNDQASRNPPKNTQARRRYGVPMGALAFMFLLAPCARAAGPVSVGANIGISQASGVGRAKDFGLSGAYRLNRAFAVRLGYESITSFEMTVFSLAVTGRYPPVLTRPLARAHRWRPLERESVWAPVGAGPKPAPRGRALLSRRGPLE